MGGNSGSRSPKGAINLSRATFLLVSYFGCPGDGLYECVSGIRGTVSCELTRAKRYFKYTLHMGDEDENSSMAKEDGKLFLRLRKYTCNEITCVRLKSNNAVPMCTFDETVTAGHVRLKKKEK